MLSSTAHSPEMGERIGAVQFDVGGRGGEGGVRVAGGWGEGGGRVGGRVGVGSKGVRFPPLSSHLTMLPSQYPVPCRRRYISR